MSRVFIDDDFIDVVDDTWVELSPTNNFNVIVSDEDNEGEGSSGIAQRLRRRRVVVEESLLENGISAVNIPEGVLSPKTPRRRSKRKSTTDGSVSPSNSKKAASAAALNSAEEDECLCPICYSEYSSGGPHRLTSLKCGHLFGRSCVEQWICAGKNNTCPTCKAKTRLTDVRNIFATKIQVADTELVDRLTASNDALKRQTECMAVQMKSLKRDLHVSQNLIRRLLQARQQIPRFFIMLDEIPFAGLRISRETMGVRCFDHSDLDESVVVGIPLTTLSPPSFGIRRIFHNRPGSVVSGVHSKPIRFCRISPFLSDVVLTTGEDRSVCVTDFRQTGANKLRYRIPLDAPGWCCDWLSTHCFVVGQMNGRVVRYSLIDTAIAEVSTLEYAHSPDVVPLEEEPRDLSLGNGRIPIFHVEWSARNRLLFIVSLRSVAAYLNGEYYTLVDNRGAIQSFNYDTSCDQFAVSFAPGANGRKFIVFSLYELIVDSVNGKVFCELIKEWTSDSDTQTFLTRYAMWSTPPDVENPVKSEGFYVARGGSESAVEKCRLAPQLQAVYDQNRMELVVMDWNALGDGYDPLAIARLRIGRPVKQISVCRHRSSWGTNIQRPGSPVFQAYTLMVLSEGKVEFVECRLQRKN